jgi:signal transduction histidine kinase
MRLAYHGYRAKDKSFNARFETRLDPSLPKANVVIQDIGRVILNLINNAAYAVNEKSKIMGQDYGALVKLSTKRLQDNIEIRLEDNGIGIPDAIREKIFQPFFTNKPTGQGTGLGLSLSYDIVKAHGGTLEVNSQEGVGSEFIVRLPTNHG